MCSHNDINHLQPELGLTEDATQHIENQMAELEAEDGTRTEKYIRLEERLWENEERTSIYVQRLQATPAHHAVLEATEENMR